MSTKSNVFPSEARRVHRTLGNVGLATSIFILMLSRAAFAVFLPGPSHSTNIALTYDNKRLVVANREADTVSVIAVKDASNNDIHTKLAEIRVGIEPRCVAISPDNQRAFVTNGVDGTVTVISLVNFSVLGTIAVGVEPRGCALTPSGNFLYVANHTSGTVSKINTATFAVTNVTTGGNPYAIAITKNGTGDDSLQKVFVTDFFAGLVPATGKEGFDTGKQGKVWAFPVTGGAITVIPLSPLKNTGFTADRTAFCPKSNPDLHNALFCPDVNATPGSDIITKNPQGCFPNQLFSGVIRGNRLRLTTICAEPEPPVQFTTNIQAVIKSVNIGTLKEVAAEDDNLNAQIKTEPNPASPTTSLQRLFGGDIAAIDATLGGAVFLVASRTNDYVVRATVNASGLLDIHAPSTVVRFRTGHIPTGVVISTDGTRAYTNNEVSTSVSVLNLVNNTTLFTDIFASQPPPPGTLDATIRLGKLVFFTGLGVPDDSSIFSTRIQNINTLANRGKASNNGWSSCASCHPDGLSDHATWIFAAGPRRSLPLDGTIDKVNQFNTRVLNWSANRDSNTDFNQNSIGVQGGTGFAGTPPDPSIYDHGVIEGFPPLDALNTWVAFAARPLFQPQPTNLTALNQGKTLFKNNCASCHGGPKWTKSQIMYLDNPSFFADPNAANAGVPIDPGIKNAGAQIVSVSRPNNSFEITFKYLEGVGTFNPAAPLEIRGQGAKAGQLALGGLGFNVPSLLSIAYHAPFFHNGSAQTLQQVFQAHRLPNGKTISNTITDPTQQANLLLFLKSIDGETPLFQSEAEKFKAGQ